MLTERRTSAEQHKTECGCRASGGSEPGQRRGSSQYTWHLVDLAGVAAQVGVLADQPVQARVVNMLSKRHSKDVAGTHLRLHLNMV